MTLQEARARLPVLPGVTGWTNPFKVPQRVTILVGLPRGSELKDRNVTVEIVWAPGERIVLPNEWAISLHRVHAGAVIGGAAPGLVRDGQVETVDPTLADSFPGSDGQRPARVHKRLIAD
jgi:hypothetical protein